MPLAIFTKNTRSPVTMKIWAMNVDLQQKVMYLFTLLKKEFLVYLLESTLNVWSFPISH